MESCPTCNLKYIGNYKYNHELTNTDLAAINQYYCQQCARIINRANERFNLPSDEHKINFIKMWFCEPCQKDIDRNTKFSHIKLETHTESENFSRINFNLTDKTYAYLSPEFDQVDCLVKRTFDECRK